MASGISTAEMVKVQVRCPTIQDTKRTMGLVVAPRCLEGDLSIFSELCALFWHVFLLLQTATEDQKKGASKTHKVEISIVGI